MDLIPSNTHTADDVEGLNHAQSSRTINHLKVLKSSSPQVKCLFSRITCISCLGVAIFLICLTQEFTYILNYHSYTMTKTWMEKRSSAFKSFNQYSWKLSPNKLHPQNWGQFSVNVNTLSYDLHRISYKTSKLSTFTLPTATLHTQNQSVEVVNSTDDWRRIMDGIYAYSAYWDNRFGSKSLVRIIAGLVVPNVNLNKLKCLLSNGSSPEVYDEVTSTHEILFEHHGTSSRAAFIKCSLPQDFRPKFVALVPGMWNRTWNLDLIWMRVYHFGNNQESNISLGVCVRPMFNYSDTFRLVEFISYYEALGVDRFTFYNYDTIPEVSRLITHLQDSNYSIDWFPWSLPPDIENMWSMGQIANINDCIYRHMGTASYIAVVDLDEFITPRTVLTIHELMSFHDVPWKNLGSFVIRSCVFCSEYESYSFPSVIPNFVTQTSIRRENKIWPYHQRSKYVVKPDLMISAAIHYVKEHTPLAKEYLLKPSQVLLHHYRAELCGDNGNKLQKGEIDAMSRKYLGHLLKSKAMQVYQEFMKI